ncbi:hypothetical protein ALI22I_29595 [Saccharothrix sp. ALI-22-I]|uniref:hypothetical protein n=1 Tax=Saccharothrix sp. ALI-22-I TaxID=1933778 RepID=UPI00097CB1BA|nr:hypothetical protein [Saccharothrix sp. ALI-22-I]ONI84683.1 hypothetical protein ALI22I_29595 [Saccharothrix sp. ALI-22-I]
MIVAAVPVVLALWATTPPGGYLGMALLAFVCWAVVGIAWLVVGVFAVLALPRPRPPHIARLWPFLLVPALFLLTGLVVGTNAVRHVAFEAHRSGLEALVADVAVAPDQRLLDRRVGLHSVSVAKLDAAGGCTLLTVEDAGFLDSTGYAYCPDRVPVDATGDGLRYEPLDGPWYEFRFVW